jgi:hypothetical protein
MVTAEGRAGESAVDIAQGTAENCSVRRGTDKFTFAKVTNGCIWAGTALFIDKGGGVLRDSYRKEQKKFLSLLVNLGNKALLQKANSRFVSVDVFDSFDVNKFIQVVDHGIKFIAN